MSLTCSIDEKSEREDVGRNCHFASTTRLAKHIESAGATL